MGIRARRWVAAGAVAALGGGAPGSADAEAGGSAPLADDPTLVALAVALACAEAQDTGALAPGEAGEQGPAGPGLELVATVRARALRFDAVPELDLVFHGTGRRRTVWKAERVNLPRHPQPGVVYRDVEVRLTISSDLDELTSLLRQAKRASAAVRIEGDAPPAAIPVGPARPIEIAPPSPPAAPQPIAAPAAAAAAQVAPAPAPPEGSR
jgi:hypothetical protein